MPQITNHIVKVIYQKLEESYFTAASFLLTFPDKGKILLECKFIDDQSYFFQILTSEYSSSTFYVRYSPGSVRVVESVEDIKDFDKCIGYISYWLNNLKNELRASRIYGEFDDFKKKIQEEINDKVGQVNGYFTREELERLNAAIDDLSKKFDDLHQKNEITQEELNSIKSKLNSYKNEAKEMPKKSWFRAMGSSFSSIMIKFFSSKSGQELIEEGTKKLLGIDIK